MVISYSNTILFYVSEIKISNGGKDYTEIRLNDWKIYDWKMWGNRKSQDTHLVCDPADIVGRIKLRLG